MTAWTRMAAIGVLVGLCAGLIPFAVVFVLPGLAVEWMASWLHVVAKRRQ